MHDVHFRRNDEVDVYRGGTSLLTAQRQKSGGIVVTARSGAYRDQECSEVLFRRWSAAEPGFDEALRAYLRDVFVRHTLMEKEGALQDRWSQVTWPWISFDREVSLAYASNQARADYRCKALRSAMKAHCEARNVASERMWELPKEVKASSRSEIDQLAIDSKGRLVLVELKRGNSDDYYAPLQLLQYVWEWHSALANVRAGLQAVIDARMDLGLVSPEVPRLTQGIRAAIGLGSDARSDEVKRRYEKVLGIVNQRLPPGVDPIETWEYTDGGPRRVAAAP